MQLEDKVTPSDRRESIVEPIVKPIVEPIAANPPTRGFPWKLILGLVIGLPVGEIGLLIGGLSLLNWYFVPEMSCGEPPAAIEKSSNVKPSPQPSPRNTP
jgi:hypothetical protein